MPAAAEVPAQRFVQLKRMQALVNTEAEPNVTQFLTDACDITGRCCNLDLKAQVWQLQKDYAKGLEASRRKVFPNARPCDDFPHMRRASYSTLKEKMGAVGGCGAQLDVQQQRHCNSTYV